MKLLTHLLAGLLGFAFVAGGLMFLLKLGPTPPPPAAETPPALFMEAFVPTGYMAFVKVLEVLGGLLVIVPRTRNFGLLILGPIIVNILAFHLFLNRGVGLFDPAVIVISGIALFLLWAGRRQFLGLISSSPAASNPNQP